MDYTYDINDKHLSYPIMFTQRVKCLNWYNLYIEAQMVTCPVSIHFAFHSQFVFFFLFWWFKMCPLSSAQCSLEMEPSNIFPTFDLNLTFILIIIIIAQINRHFLAIMSHGHSQKWLFNGLTDIGLDSISYLHHNFVPILSFFIFSLVSFRKVLWNSQNFRGLIFNVGQSIR